MNVFRFCRIVNIHPTLTSSQRFSSCTVSAISNGTAATRTFQTPLFTNASKINVPKMRVAGVLPPVYFRTFSSDTSSTSPAQKERLDKLVKNNKIVVFMKGVPDEPRCGFSNAVVQILRMHGVTNYDSHNVLEDEVIRQGIKDYTNWPTIPQVFINGEFVGGCDILIEMHKNGELVEQLSKVGIKSALLDQEQSENKDGASKK